ncbi:hypothetical protein J3459_021584 [Metarhizium acridum]|nr:hypothetical protein J3459_021584 [Metarhizium acridum]
MGQGPPPMGGPPQGGPGGPPPGFGAPQGYPPGPPPAQGGPIAQQFQRPNPNPAAEVEGASKSKAQLIVGIDFVSAAPASFACVARIESPHEKEEKKVMGKATALNMVC